MYEALQQLEWILQLDWMRQLEWILQHHPLVGLPLFLLVHQAVPQLLPQLEGLEPQFQLLQED